MVSLKGVKPEDELLRTPEHGVEVWRVRHPVPVLKKILAVLKEES